MFKINGAHKDKEYSFPEIERNTGSISRLFSFLVRMALQFCISDNKIKKKVVE